MLNVDRYIIRNASLVGRILPFFARGKKMQSFLIGITQPLVSLHESFLSWAIDRKAECVATSQKIVLRWYLTKIFQRVMVNKNAQFAIDYVVDAGYLHIYESESELEDYLPDDNLFVFEDAADEQDVIGQEIEGVDSDCIIYTQDKDEINFDSDEATLCVYAPKQMSGLSDSDYKRLVRQCVERLAVYDMEYSVIING